MNAECLYLCAPNINEDLWVWILEDGCRDWCQLAFPDRAALGDEKEFRSAEASLIRFESIA